MREAWRSHVLIVAARACAGRCCQCCSPRVEQEQPGEERQHAERLHEAGARPVTVGPAARGGWSATRARGARRSSASSCCPGPSSSSSSPWRRSHSAISSSPSSPGRRTSSASPRRDGDRVGFPAQLVEVTLLRAGIRKRPASPAGAHAGEEELGLDGGGGEERHERRQPRLQVGVSPGRRPQTQAGAAPNPEGTDRHVATMLPAGRPAAGSGLVPGDDEQDDARRRGERDDDRVRQQREPKRSRRCGIADDGRRPASPSSARVSVSTMYWLRLRPAASERAASCAWSARGMRSSSRPLWVDSRGRLTWPVAGLLVAVAIASESSGSCRS